MHLILPKKQQSIKCLHSDWLWLLFHYSWKSCSARWIKDEVRRARFNCCQSFVIRSKARLWLCGSLMPASSFFCWTTNLLLISPVDGIRRCSGRTFLLYVYSPARPAADKRPPQRDAATIAWDCWDGLFVMGCRHWCGPDVPVDLRVLHMSWPFTLLHYTNQSHPLKPLPASELEFLLKLFDHSP